MNWLYNGESIQENPFFSQDEEFGLNFRASGIKMEKYLDKVRSGGLQVLPQFMAILSYDAGWSSPVARWAHNPKVRGSNPLPATKNIKGLSWWLNPFQFFCDTLQILCLPFTLSFT